MTQKKIRLAYYAVCLVLSWYLFGFTILEDETRYYLRWMYLTKIHLHHELAFPYLTPGSCGGMVLGGHVGYPLFTLYSLFGLIFDHQYLAVQWATVLIGVIFCGGVYYWMGRLTPSSPWVRAAASLVVSFSGAWMIRIKTGHFSYDCVAFTPWLMGYLDELISRRRSIDFRQAIRAVAVLTLILFATLNSGHFWLQVTVPIGIGWIVAELLPFGEKRVAGNVKKTFVILAVSGVFAILLSLGRIVSIKHFYSDPFSRRVDLYGVIQSTSYVIETILRALFDPTVLTLKKGAWHVGSHIEGTAYLGITTLPFFLLGFVTLKRHLKSRAFLTLVIACAIAFIFFRTPHITNFLRQLFPQLAGVTHMFRGVVVFAFIAGALIVAGAGWVFDRWPKFRWAMALYALLVFVDLGYVYSTLGFYKKPHQEWVDFNYSIPERITELVPSDDLRVLAEGKSELKCSDTTLCGYENESCKGHTFAGPYQAIENEMFNQNDIYTLFGEFGSDGKYKVNNWLRWPLDRREELDRFMAFKQVFQPWPQVTRAWKISLAALIAYLGVCIFSVVSLRRKDSDTLPT